jgi:hypothetical protein
MTKNTIEALKLIKNSSSIDGFHIEGYNLDIKNIYNDADEEDDILIAGTYCTIFVDDLIDCVIINKTIYIKGHYVIHCK